MTAKKDHTIKVAVIGGVSAAVVAVIGILPSVLSDDDKKVKSPALSPPEQVRDLKRLTAHVERIDSALQAVFSAFKEGRAKPTEDEAEELHAILSRLSILAGAQAVWTDLVDDYLDGESWATWVDVKSGAIALSRSVRDALRHVRRNDKLLMTLDAASRVALDRLFAQRAAVLVAVDRMDEPTGDESREALARLGARYKRLAEQLDDHTQVLAQFVSSTGQ